MRLHPPNPGNSSDRHVWCGWNEWHSCSVSCGPYAGYRLRLWGRQPNENSTCNISKQPENGPSISICALSPTCPDDGTPSAEGVIWGLGMVALFVAAAMTVTAIILVKKPSIVGAANDDSDGEDEPTERAYTHQSTAEGTSTGASLRSRALATSGSRTVHGLKQCAGDVRGTGLTRDRSLVGLGWATSESNGRLWVVQLQRGLPYGGGSRSTTPTTMTPTMAAMMPTAATKRGAALMPAMAAAKTPMAAVFPRAPMQKPQAAVAVGPAAKAATAAAAAVAEEIGAPTAAARAKRDRTAPASMVAADARARSKPKAHSEGKASHKAKLKPKQGGETSNKTQKVLMPDISWNKDSIVIAIDGKATPSEGQRSQPIYDSSIPAEVVAAWAAVDEPALGAARQTKSPERTPRNDS